MKFKSMVIGLLIGGLLLFMPGCKQGDAGLNNPSGQLLSSNGCKNIQETRSTVEISTPQAVQECIQYQYDGQSSLAIAHINGVFNCCPGVIKANFEFGENTITISEWSTEHACRCNCYFDVNYRFVNIAPGTLTIRIVCEGGSVLEVTTDLNSTPSGSQCWDSPGLEPYGI